MTDEDGRVRASVVEGLWGLKSPENRTRHLPPLDVWLSVTARKNIRISAT